LQGVRIKGSCHGVCHIIVFDDNHTKMKAWAQRLVERLAERKLHVWNAKKKCWQIPLDLSVYSMWRNFRFYKSAKMVTTEEECRPLVAAPYNRYHDMPTTEEEIFLLSVIPQPPYYKNNSPFL
jgi:hypothetical protein